MLVTCVKYNNYKLTGKDPPRYTSWTGAPNMAGSLSSRRSVPGVNTESPLLPPDAVPSSTAGRLLPF